jgi:hypothetical protein
MRLLSLNLLTATVTAILLGVLTLPAMAVRRSVPVRPTPTVHAFGVYVDPWHIDDWASAIGATPTIAAKFESFSRQRTIDNFANEASRRGIRTLLISWEPWKPVRATLGVYRTSYPQLGYRNLDIANGSQDVYIRQFAQSVAAFHGTVYIRYAHEMNGFWYPWSWDARDYRRAFRRVVRLFHEEGATNAKFVWSVNPNLYDPPARWMHNLQLYWPGAKYVDAVGLTMINFGGKKLYGVPAFASRLRAVRQAFRKPVLITETNTQYGGRVQWLRSLRRMLHRMPWIKAVIWSQLPSRGAAQMKAGDLHWNVQRDPAGAAVLRAIINDGLGR